MKISAFGLAAALVAGVWPVSGGVVVKSGERIAFLGDSITNFGNQQPGGYVNLVMDGLRRAGVEAVKIPAGWNGNKAHEMLARFQRDVVAKKADWVTVSVGVNDVGWGARGNELEPFKKYVSQIFDKADAAGIKVVVMTPSFCRESVDYMANANNAKLEGYARFMREEAARRGYLLADVNADLRRVLEGYKTAPGPRLSTDGLHMNGYGNRLMAASVLRAFGLDSESLNRYMKAWERERPAMYLPQTGVTIAQYERLKAAAEKEGVDFGVYARRILNDAVNAAVGALSPVGIASARYPVRTVQDVAGYNSWQMIQALGKRLVCAYSRGSAHTIGEGKRGVFARYSDDGGRTWSKETTVADSPGYGEVTIGKGLDKDGAMLLWVRCWGGKKNHHDLYRSKDGVAFEKISSPELSPLPMQITDVFDVPGTGLMSLWFAGNYRDDARNAWGTIVSTDNGRSWKQHTVEKGIAKREWPTEPSAVHLGGGRILCISRSEGGAKYQFQLTSLDGGRTWKKAKTNISDVLESTPSLVFDRKSGTLANYYYQRGARKLKRRVTKADWIFDRPLEWPEPEVIAVGEEARAYDAGNVSATSIGRTHYPAFYTGSTSDTAVFVAEVPAP